MFVTKRKVCAGFAMTCKFVKKFLMAKLVIHKRQHVDAVYVVVDSIGSDCKQVLNEVETNYALHRKEIAENEANEALLTSSLSYFDGATTTREEHQYPLPSPSPSPSVKCFYTQDGSFYWDISMQQLPVDRDLIEVHDSSLRSLLAAN